MDTLVDSQATIIETDQSINFKSLRHICTCSDDFLVEDKNFQNCLKGCKW